LLNQLPSFESSGSVIASLYALKREPVQGGPYPGVSFFEAANRVLSDITILLGVRQLLLDPVVGSLELPFTAYSAALGVTDGFDVIAGKGACRLVGEAFNVVPSFFQTKKAKMLRKLRAEDAAYRLLIFNADAVRRPAAYVAKSTPSMLYLPVDVLGWARE
jgi:hypothetical protein